MADLTVIPDMLCARQGKEPGERSRFQPTSMTLMACAWLPELSLTVTVIWYAPGNSSPSEKMPVQEMPVAWPRDTLPLFKLQEAWQPSVTSWPPTVTVIVHDKPGDAM